VLKPAYKVIVGHKFIDTTDQPKASTVTDLTVTLDLNTPADSATLMLGNVNGLQPALSDQLKISLGYEDDTPHFTQVFAGAVSTVEPSITTKRVIGYTAAAILLKTFVDKTYESKTAGQIVRDLVSKAKEGTAGGSAVPVGGGVGEALGSAIAGSSATPPLEIASAEDGITFPAYVIDGQRSVYHHMGDLAALCGFDLYFNADGKLVFEPFVNGKTIHVFEYGKHIIELDVKRASPLASTVEAWGESPAGKGGANAWAWLTNDFSSAKGSAGAGNAKLLLERPALRTAAAAHTAAEALLNTLQHNTVQGRLLVLGDPAVKLGDAIRLVGLPDASLNGAYQVRNVTHRITKLGGFTTAIGFRGF